MTRLAWPRVAWDLGAVAVMIAVAVVGFAPSFATPLWIVAGFGGLVLGLVIAVVGAWQRWSVLVLAAVTVVVYFVLGGALAMPETTIARVVPTLPTLQSLATAAVFSWKQYLTAIAPLTGGDGALVVPLLATLSATVTTASLALRARKPAWALLPAGILLILAISFGLARPALPLAQGAAFALAAVAWLAYRATRDAAGDGVVGGGRARRIVAAGIVLVVGLGAGTAASAFAAPQTARHVLREVVIPPLDLRQFPSPLQAFRKYVSDDTVIEGADAPPAEPLFTVSGLPAGARVRLATLDAYDGLVYSVARDVSGQSASFARLGDGVVEERTGEQATIHVEIDRYAGPWVPDAGYLSTATFEGDRAADLARTTYYNRTSGTALAIAGLAAGDSYTIRTVVPAIPGDDDLRAAGIAAAKLPEPEGVPESVTSFANTTTAGAKSPVDQLLMLRDSLATGYFSHGVGDQPTSRSGHGAERIHAFLTDDRLIGDDEQYAVAMALSARALGIPARVVMGFYPEADAAASDVFSVTGDALHAWVEVPFDGYGWVPLDPTPDEQNTPPDDQSDPKPDIQPQVLQPPPPVQESVELPPALATDEGEGDDDAPGAGFPWLAVIGMSAAGLGVLLVLAAPFLAIALLKLRRRRARRRAAHPAARISGGWHEVLDNARDLGASVAPGRTRSEEARMLLAAFDDPTAVALADSADARVFGPGEPTAAQVDEFWSSADALVAGLRGRVGPWRRIRARVSLHSLRTPSGSDPRTRARTKHHESKETR